MYYGGACVLCWRMGWEMDAWVEGLVGYEDVK
jgi:hypothetical protein